MIQRVRGLFYGGAVGDALGAPAEFKKRKTFPKITEMQPVSHFGLQKGSWTDDTSMFLCLLDSLISSKGHDPKDQLMKYTKWYKEGYLSVNDSCFDIGNATKAAVNEFLSSGTLKAKYTERSAGNGSLMRIGAVPLFFHATKRQKEVALLCAESSLTTHSHPECVLACFYYGGLLYAALKGSTKTEILNSTWADECEKWARENKIDAPETIQVIKGRYQRKTESEISTSGYVVSSLEAALYALVNTNSFEDGCILLANMGDDSDTVCCIYGYLAGALYGYTSIPVRWLKELQKKEVFEMFERRLFLDKQ